MNKAIVAGIVILMTASVSFGLNIKQIKELKSWKSAIVQENKIVKKKCGKEIPTKLDEALVPVFVEKRTSAASYCKQVMSAIRGFCDDKDIKEIVLKKIQSLNCKLGKTPKKMEFKLEGTELVAGFTQGTANIAQVTKDWIENNL